MPASKYPTKKVLSDLKASILAPAQTSHFQCWFDTPSGVLAKPSEDNIDNWFEERKQAGLGVPYRGNENFFSLSCCEASLPGSTLATHEINNDYTGVTERHAYRRQYDDRADFTFYVDRNYYVIHLFENWMSYIVNEQFTQGLEDNNYNYRVNFPQTYQTTIYINKFEKDYANRFLEYSFLKAFPISINSMPVSYNNSELLKCTVSFSYSRYTVKSVKQPSQEVTLIRPNNQEPIVTRVDDGRSTLAQLAEQLEAQGGRGDNFGPNILR